jgi:hypothetical protein
MSVRALTENGDWTFGRSRSELLTRSAEIAQNLDTRLKSFKFDWFLDTQANIDWFNLLGIKSNDDAIVSEVTRVAESTVGVKNVISVEILSIRDRQATIQIRYEDIYNVEFLRTLDI